MIGILVGDEGEKCVVWMLWEKILTLNFTHFMITLVSAAKRCHNITPTNN